MSYNSNLPADTTAPAEIRENFRALKEDKIVAAATAVTAESADKLTIARNISLTGDATGSVAFDGSTDVSIAVDVVSADVSASCTGNAASATKLETARNINGVAFDGTVDITIKAEADGGNADTVDGLHASELILAAIPIGGIIMWSGSIASIPSKWALCNGLNGTPSLTNRFVLGAGSSYAVGANGGEATHTLTVNEMPSHNHGFIPCLGAYDSGVQNFLRSTTYDAAWISETYSTGGNQPHNNMPPYYALAYIMRIA